MSLSILSDALNLEADAADLRIQVSIVKIMGSEYPSRTAANEAIQLYHASLITLKHLVAIDNASGRRVTLRCFDESCQVKVSIRQFANGGSPYWQIYNRKGVAEEWHHGFFRNNIPSFPAKIAAKLLKDEVSRGKHLCLQAKKKRINLGGSQPTITGISHAHHVAAGRVTAELNKIQRAENYYMNELSGPFKVYPGAYANYVVEGKVFKRCILIPQLSIAMFKHGYLKILFWKNTDNRDNKLLPIYGTTGNDQNCTLVWSVVDGEKKSYV